MIDAELIKSLPSGASDQSDEAPKTAAIRPRSGSQWA
jgi:hypothetical protein